MREPALLLKMMPAFELRQGVRSEIEARGPSRLDEATEPWRPSSALVQSTVASAPLSWPHSADGGRARLSERDRGWSLRPSGARPASRVPRTARLFPHAP